MIRYLILFAFLAGLVLSNPCKNVKTGRRLQDPTECRGYILCHRERSYYRTCAFGTKFDEAQQKCVRGKCPPCNCTPATPAPTPAPTPSPTPAPTQAPTQDPTPTPTAAPTAAPIAVQCESHLNGKSIPDPKDCSKFWVCVYDTPMQRECPLGLWFDENLLVCNRPENAMCTAAAQFKQNNSI